MAIGIMYGAAVVTAAIISSLVLTRAPVRETLAIRETLYSDKPR